MKKTNPFNAVRALLTVTVMILSACGPNAPVQGGGSSKVQASPVEIIGVIETINGDQWTVNGQTVTVAPEAAAGASFKVGDSVHVSGVLGADGTVTASSVGLPANAAVAGTDDASATDEPTDSGETSGVVDSISSSEIVVGGTSYVIDGSTEIKDNIAVGDNVKVHFVTNADGTFTATEIELSDGSGGGTGSDECDDDDAENVNSNDNSDDSDDSNDNADDNSNDSNENTSEDCEGDDDDDSNVNGDDNSNEDGDEDEDEDEDDDQDDNSNDDNENDSDDDDDSNDNDDDNSNDD